MPVKKTPTRRNPIAQDLARPIYRKRIQQDRKRQAKSGYTKHKQPRAA
jgi:hypothetical protein